MSLCESSSKLSASSRFVSSALHEMLSYDLENISWEYGSGNVPDHDKF
jgi:hypothetical protein